MAAFAADIENFTLELGETLILPARIAAQVVNDPGGEPLACGCKALDMPSAVFQRMLLFLKPDFGIFSEHRLPAVAALRPPERTLRTDHAGGMARLDDGGGARQISALALRRRTPSRPRRNRPGAPGAAARLGRRRAQQLEKFRAIDGPARSDGLTPAPDRGNAALPDPRSRRSRHRDRNGFPWPAAPRPRLPAPAATMSA